MVSNLLGNAAKTGEDVSVAARVWDAWQGMKVRVSGKQFDIGETLPGQVRLRMQTAIGKHFDRGAESNVVFSHEGSGFRADCTAHLDSGAVLKSEGSGEDPYRAFDAALGKLEKQIRRYKRRIKSHHEKGKAQQNPGA